MSLKRTPLFDAHVALKAKIVPFAGWEMPVQYAGLVVEHQAVRTGCGIFDVSHMGEIFIQGKNAGSFLQSILSNDLSKIGDGKAQYNLLLNEIGGVVDDLIVYRRGADTFLLCVNASNTEAGMAWISSAVSAGKVQEVSVTNESDRWGQIAVQGPKSFEILARTDLSSAKTFPHIPPFGFLTVNEKNLGELLIARTGYTGEDGVEIFCPTNATPVLWEKLIQAGAVPCGLGARDTLRLEACYPLHGHELAEDISALESDLGWVIKFAKGEFIGRAPLLTQKEAGVARLIVGFEMLDPGIARSGDLVVDAGGKQIGVVTSGTKTPTVGKAIGLALIPTELAKSDTKISIKVREKVLSAKVVKKPFYKRKT